MIISCILHQAQYRIPALTLVNSEVSVCQELGLKC